MPSSSLTLSINKIDCDCASTGCPTAPMTLQIRLGDVKTGETIVISFPNGQPSVQRSNSLKKNLPPVNTNARIHLWQGNELFYSAVQSIPDLSDNKPVPGIAKFMSVSGSPNCFITMTYTVKQKAMSRAA